MSKRNWYVLTAEWLGYSKREVELSVSTAKVRDSEAFEVYAGRKEDKNWIRLH